MTDTPEEAFIVDPRLHGEAIGVDAVICICDRMKSLLTLLGVAGQDAQHGFMVSHSAVMSALWLLDAQVQQLRALALAANGRPLEAQP